MVTFLYLLSIGVKIISTYISLNSMANKMIIKKPYLIITLLLSVFILGGCANKAEKLTELQQNQQQLQQQAVIKKAEAAEAIKNAKKYDKLTNKYETPVQ